MGLRELDHFEFKLRLKNLQVLSTFIVVTSTTIPSMHIAQLRLKRQFSNCHLHHIGLLGDRSKKSEKHFTFGASSLPRKLVQFFVLFSIKNQTNVALPQTSSSGSSSSFGLSHSSPLPPLPFFNQIVSLFLFYLCCFSSHASPQC